MKQFMEMEEAQMDKNKYMIEKIGLLELEESSDGVYVFCQFFVFLIGLCLVNVDGLNFFVVVCCLILGIEKMEQPRSESATISFNLRR
jgi:hypothetical protein